MSDGVQVGVEVFARILLVGDGGAGHLLHLGLALILLGRVAWWIGVSDSSIVKAEKVLTLFSPMA